MTTNHLSPDLLPMVLGVEERSGAGFGLGFSVVLDVGLTGQPGSVGLHRWGGWAHTQFWIDPQEQLVGILMLQHVAAAAHPVTTDFRTLVYQALVD